MISSLPKVKRFALWKAHNEHCIYCSQPLLFREMHIDHIIPKHLLDEKEKFEKIITDYGLDWNFEINGYENLIPSHSACNLEKKGDIFSESSARFYLLIAKSNSQKAHDFENEYKEAKLFDEIINNFLILIENGAISQESAHTLIDGGISHEDDSIVISFGVNVTELVESDNLPESAPIVYCELCDWLEQELKTYIATIVTCPFYQSEASFRNGEGLSIRFAFENLNPDVINKFSSAWWEIMDVNWFSKIYPEED